MPLRVWRTDDVMPLAPHPNDPPPDRRSSDPAGLEFLTSFDLTVPAGTPVADVDETKAREAARARELSEAGKLVRLWAVRTPAGRSRAYGLWRVADAAEMQAVLASLPLSDWMTVETTPLTKHPNDPAAPAR